MCRHGLRVCSLRICASFFEFSAADAAELVGAGQVAGNGAEAGGRQTKLDHAYRTYLSKVSQARGVARGVGVHGVAHCPIRPRRRNLKAVGPISKLVSAGLGTNVAPRFVALSMLIPSHTHKVCTSSGAASGETPERGLASAFGVSSSGWSPGGPDGG